MKRFQIFCAVFSVFFLITYVYAGVQSQHSNPVMSADLMASPHKGGARRWQVRSMHGVILLDAPGGREVSDHVIKQHAVVTNFGCSETDGRVWCEVRPLHSGPRGFVIADSLEPVAGPDGIIARGTDESARRARRKNFDVTATVRCAQEQGQELSICRVGVARSEGGDATVAVTFGNGFTRLLYFMNGAFISASATMSGAGRDTDWLLMDDIHFIRADDQRFEIPDALLFKQH